jgi:carboxylesterase
MTNPHLHNPHLEGDPFFLEGSGQTGVLLIHGLTATTTEVRRLGRSLNRAGFSVSAPLLPGHGETPAALNRTRWQDWYDATQQAYQNLAGRCARVVVGGESTGGLLALLLAARNPQIDGVLAYAPALLLPLSRLQVLTLNLFAPFVPSLPKKHILEDKTWQGYKVNPLKGILQLRKLQKVVREELGNIQQPLLLLQGRMDKTIDLRSAEAVYNAVGSTVKELHWLEKSDHCLLLDCEVHEATRLTMSFLYKVQAQKKSG